MATVLKIKNTALGGRKPTSAQLETAELAVNLADAKLYTKTAGDQIIALGGSINSGATADRPNFPAVGDLFYDTDNAALYYYNGSAWVALSDGDDVDLGYTAAADKGTVTNTAGSDAELPVVTGTNAGLMAPAEYTKLTGLSNFTTSPSQPGSPSANDLWIDTNECPPEIKVYTDCEGSGFEWISIGGGGLDVTFDLAMTGGDVVGDEKEAVVTNILPAGLTPAYAWSVDGVVDGSATTNKRVNKTSDVGFAVKCTVTIIDKVKDVTSANVVKWPDFTFALVFSPANVLLGDAITVATNPDPVVGGNGLDATFVSRQWTRNGSDIGGETAATYTTQAGDDTATIGCTLVYRNSDSSGNDVTVSANYPGAINTASIATPSIIAPKSGAGEGGDVNYYPQTSAVDSVLEVGGETATLSSKISFTPSGTVLEYDGSTVTLNQLFKPQSDPNFIYWAYPENWESGGGKDTRYWTFDLSQLPLNPGDEVVLRHGTSSNQCVDIGDGNGWVELTSTGGNKTSIIYDGTNTTVSSNSSDSTTIVYLGQISTIKLGWSGTKTEAIGYYYINNDPFPDLTDTYTSPILAELTLTNNKTFDSTDGTTERGTINSDLLPGALVTSDTAPAGTSAAFSTTLYAGTEGTASPTQSITTGIDNSKKSLIWIKGRTGTTAPYLDHALFDNVRGVHKMLRSNDGGSTLVDTNSLTAFNNNGFTTGASATTNSGTANFVAWNFRAAPGFFDVVAFNNTGYPISDQIPHNLTSSPGCIIVKQTDANREWFVYHTGLADPANDYLKLDSTNGAASPGASNNTWIVDDNTFGSGSGLIPVGEHVAYLFADNPTGGVKCDHYNIGDGSSYPYTINTGFKVGWLLIKCSSHSSTNWVIFDSTRPSGEALFPDDSDQAIDYSAHFEFDASDGFILKSSDPLNLFGGAFRNYEYIAIAEDVTAGNFPPTGIVSEANDTDSTLTLTNVSGTWEAGMRATGGTELTEYAPDPAALEFVGSIPNGTNVNSWSYACWEVSENSDFSGTVLKAEPAITNPTALQTLPAGTLALANDTQYYAQLKYEASDPAIESNYSTTVNFKTVPAKPVFSTTIYDGTSTERTQTTGIDNTNKSLVWFKCRNQAGFNHILINTLQPDTYLSSDRSLGEESSSALIGNFLSDGLVLKDNAYVNTTQFNAKYALWNFRAAPGFMDIITYEGTYISSGEINPVQIVSHSLGVTPGVMIIKSTSHPEDWIVYHKELGATQFLKLNKTQGAEIYSAYFNDTEPTENVFTVGPQGATNMKDRTYVAYLFADNPTGGIKCGSYSADGSDPQQVDVGFEPEWVMVKNYSDTDGPYGNWYICDNKRPNKSLVANRTDAEDGTYTSPPDVITLNSTGFSVPAGRSSVSAGNLIYVAIAKDVVA